jgi:hypothetical protein
MYKKRKHLNMELRSSVIAHSKCLHPKQVIVRGSKAIRIAQNLLKHVLLRRIHLIIACPKD